MTERRFDPETGEWRMFAGVRQARTFLPPAGSCPLCPTTDASVPTEVPFPTYDVVVFENRFPSLVPEPPEPDEAGSDLYPVAPSVGANEVVVYSDDHTLGIGGMEPERIARLVDVWADRYAALGARPEIAYVFVFENRGVAVGVTLHHPHGQIYAYPEVPPRAQRKLDVARAHLEDHGTCVYCDVVARETAGGVRVVARNRSFVAFVPFAARFPYEIHVVARRHAPSLLDLSDHERLSLAQMLKQVIAGYDSLFGFELPYVMSMHQEPTEGPQHRGYSHLHIEFTPLHRTADKLKYLAGSELGAGAFVNDTRPEDKAGELRSAIGRAAVPAEQDPA